jgi:hypothetical protein
MNCDSRNIGTPSGRFVRSDGNLGATAVSKNALNCAPRSPQTNSHVSARVLLVVMPNDGLFFDTSDPPYPS